ncbi:MAG: electron transfer flavoprotein beta subunit/FixA family protein, partial [Chloroflexi bacterium]
GGTATAKREIPGGWEVYQVTLPAAFTVKEGINLPRYPSLPGRLKAKRKPVDQSQPQPSAGGLQKIILKNPKESSSQAQILGEGAAAAPKVVEILKELGVV